MYFKNGYQDIFKEKFECFVVPILTYINLRDPTDIQMKSSKSNHLILTKFVRFLDNLCPS